MVLATKVVATEKVATHLSQKLDGDWTSPSDKYARQIESFPQGSG